MQRTLLLVLVTFSAAFSVACGSPPPAYKELRVYSRSLVGHTSIQLADNAFWVSSIQTERGYTTRLTDFTLLRSAELALEAGFAQFQIVRGADTAAELKPPYAVVRANLWNVIVCHNGTPLAPGTSWIAAEVVSGMRKKYGIAPRFE